MKKTIVELFAGVGGFRLAFENHLKWETLWANQWEPSKKNQFAYNCYIKNFSSNNAINEDISNIDKKSIPTHTLLVGGFPCQDYSVARTKAQGIAGKKGVLWWQISDIIKIKKPPFILLENVDRLLKSPSTKRGRDFGIMLRNLNDLGYGLEWRVVNAGEYGFAQRRRRVFIFCFNKKTNYHKFIKNSTPENVFNKDGIFAKSFPITKLDSSTIKSTGIVKNFEDLVDISENFSFPFENSGYMIDGVIHTSKTIPKKIKFVALADIIEKGKIEESFFINKIDLDKWQYLKGGKKISRISSEGHSYTYSEGSMRFPEDLSLPARTMLTSEGTKNRSSHVIKDFKTEKLRTITPIEAERLNGFPDNWTSGMTTRERFFCMGNALVVGVVVKIGKEINNIIKLEKK